MFVGFPLGGLLSLAIMVAAALVFAPASISVDSLSQVPLPVASSSGKVGLAARDRRHLRGHLRRRARDRRCRPGYIVAQYFGWQWGKFVKPREAARFHLVVLLVLIGALARRR